MHHALLVAGQVVGEIRLAGAGGLEQSLSETRHIAVSEDAPGARDEPLFLAVALAVLVRQEPYESLRGGEPYRLHHTSFEVPNGSRGSVARVSQVPRTQPCAGSSQISQARSGPGPAMTLR